MIKVLSIAMVAVFGFGMPISHADWDGYDWQNSADVSIEPGNRVREGNDIEVYDWSDGQYHDMTVEGVTRSGSSVEIEVYDYETGEYRYLEMED